MGKRKDLSDFDKGQIVMARRLGQSISKTAALVGCSRSAVVSTYQKWSKEGKAVNRRQGHGRPRLIDARGERRLARVVQSNRRATPESEINHAPVPETQPWSTTFKEAAGRTAKRDIAPKPRVARQERMEMLSREGCSVDHPLSDRDYQGWMDFGRRSAEERLD
ncbi:hypothetical protein JZ751_008050 [Albula glossodonta]|uniref:Gastrin/cholecystokinin peptide hormone domain-containing protein n=1 Tax=Albula glossodonta TaxID=121402 RepID=A0A8T2P0W1_9TELE|nr:hypothetical protein JZ751_008050 [Albula glossodonta]